eukprot:gene9977-8854_t
MEQTYRHVKLAREYALLNNYEMAASLLRSLESQIEAQELNTGDIVRRNKLTQ